MLQLGVILSWIWSGVPTETGNLTCSLSRCRLGCARRSGGRCCRGGGGTPREFRRADYLHLGDDSVAGFPAFLDQAADKFFILSTGHSTTGLDEVVEVTGNNVKMTRPIEDLVFDEK